MRKVASEADNTLNVLRDTEGELAALGTQEPSNWSMMSYDQKVQYLDEIKNALNGTQQLTNKLQQNNQQKQDQLKQINDLGVDMNDPSIQQQISQSAKRNIFNLKKFSQMAQAPTSMDATPMAMDGVDPSLPQTDSAMPPVDNSPTAKIRKLLDGVLEELLASGVDEGEAMRQAPDRAYSQITSQLTNPNESTVDPNTNVQGNSDQAVRDAVNTYYSTQDENEKDSAASVLARTIFPQDQNDTLDQGEVPAIQEGVKVNLANFVKETNKIIKKIAESHAKTSNKVSVFNLTKHAHVKNMTVFEPDKAIKDEFYGGAMSENDLLERNKGYGIKLDNFYSLNWEKVWRENVMDKYDPFYLERRFEVDKNIPPTNNYQLEAGEKRRITPPEYGNTEARLEANRTKMNEDRGYSPSDNGSPFNWKKAQTSKKAQTVLPKADLGNGGMNPLKPAPMQKQEWLCHACHNSLEVTDTNTPMDRCTACGALQNGKAIPGKFKTGPDPAKTTAPAGATSGPIHASGENEVEKLANAHGGIFFDSNELKFVVFAGKKKKKFDTYYEAEEFKMLVKDPSAAPGQNVNNKKRTPLTPEQIARQEQIAQHADKLAIDG